MQYLKEMTECASTTPASYAPGQYSVDEHDPLIQRESAGPEASGVGELSNGGVTKPVAGGTILGIHNLAIVMPQFIVCVFVSFHQVRDVMCTADCRCGELNLQNC
jgi:solute carrier family 45, member 1/2/4